MNEVAPQLRRAKARPNDFIPKEEYVSAAFGARERERLWPRAWQMACREEELLRVGDYVTYDICDDSIIVIRTAPDRISAYHNACQHRGRRLTDGCGHTARLVCRFHGWAWNLDGSIARVVDRENWDGTLADSDIKLPSVRVESWAGWVFVTMDTAAEPLREYLAPIPSIFANFEYEKLRYRWRKSVALECNWKVALEAFNEGYHVQTTHTQLLPVHEDQTLGVPQGRHGQYFLAPDGISMGARSARLPPADVDYRDTVREFVRILERDLSALTSARVLREVDKLLDELPEGTSQIEVLARYGEIARRAAEDEGAGFPNLTPEEIARAGADWHVFPNMVFLPAPDGMLAYRARPDRSDHEKCLFDVYALGRFAPGAEPAAEPQFFADWRAHDGWGLILTQDFENMADVQRGMRSRGFKRSRANPVQETSVSNFHRALREFIDS